MSKEIWDEVEKLALKYNDEIVLPPIITREIGEDFKRFSISLSRYKFAGKMLEGKESLLEVGCNVGFKTMIFSQFVKNVIGIDYEKPAIDCANERFAGENRRYMCADILKMPPFEEKVESVVSLDVIEHIAQEQEDEFLEAIVRNMCEDGVCIIGTPNITASAYQSEASRIGHINLYSHERLKTLMNKYFKNVFMFAMNDEVVHTGFLPMAHYLIAIGVGKRI